MTDITAKLAEALRDCVEDSQAEVDRYVQSYGENFRPARLAAMRKQVADAREALRLYEQAKPALVDPAEFDDFGAAVRHNALSAATPTPAPEADDPERRCGGPGCDGNCCQPVPEAEAKPLTDERIDALRQQDDCGEDAPEFARIVRVAEAACAEIWGVKLAGIAASNGGGNG
jgi:hypothetical protein